MLRQANTELTTVGHRIGPTNEVIGPEETYYQYTTPESTKLVPDY